MKSLKKIAFVIVLNLFFSFPLYSATLEDWNESGNGGTIWTGWNYSTDVQDNSANHNGFYENGAQSYVSCSRQPRVMEKYDYGEAVDFRIDTTKIAPSTSSGASLKAYDDGTGSVNQTGFWFFWPENLGNQGRADSTTNRMDYYIYIDGMADPDYADPPNYNFHSGDYLAWGGNECVDGGGGEGPGQQKYYHNLVYKSGAWIHASINDHPGTVRGDVYDMSLPIADYFSHLNNIYFEVRQAQTNLTTVWFDEWKLSSVTQNDITIDGLWVGYWKSSDRWEVGWYDPYTTNHYGNPANSTFEIRYSTSPITNANWSSATVVEPEVNEYGTTNTVRRPNNWKRTVLTYFYLPNSVEENSTLYFAVKDVSKVANGDAHNGDDYTAQTYITTIDYALRGAGGTVIVSPAANLRIE